MISYVFLKSASHNITLELYQLNVITIPALLTALPDTQNLKLPLPEAEMFLGKTDFKLNSMKGEGYVYQCV